MSFEQSVEREGKKRKSARQAGLLDELFDEVEFACFFVGETRHPRGLFDDFRNLGFRRRRKIENGTPVLDIHECARSLGNPVVVSSESRDHYNAGRLNQCSRQSKELLTPLLAEQTECFFQLVYNYDETRLQRRFCVLSALQILGPTSLSTNHDTRRCCRFVCQQSCKALGLIEIPLLQLG